MKILANEFPKIDADYKIAFLGDCPGADEIEFNRPYIGRGGQFLEMLMNSVGLARNSCFIGYICQQMPRGGNLSNFAWDGYEMNDSRAVLQRDLDRFDPNLVVLLGQWPLKYAGITQKVGDFRGTLFECNEEGPLYGRKCLSTYEPFNLIKAWDWWPLVQFDLQKAEREGRSNILNLPLRKHYIGLTADEICARLDAIVDGDCATDIEGGGPKGITCISFSSNEFEAFLFAPDRHNVKQQLQVMRSIKRLLGDPNVGKVLQNGLYDQFCLMHHWGMPIINMSWDTMLSGWEMYPELRKGLGVLASIYTNEPAYKFERKSNSVATFYEYNCKDSAVTLAIKNEHVKQMTAAQVEHFQHKMDLLPLAAYMTFKGTRYDHEAAQREMLLIKPELDRLQTIINTNSPIPLNCNSPKQKADVLYTRLGFEKQFQKVAGRNTTKVTTDRKALLTLTKKYNHPLPPTMLKWLALDGRRKQLEYIPDDNGRVRGFYNVVGTETGRFSCAMKESEKGDGSRLPGGVPMHVIKKENRSLYLADEGFYYFQCDLEGADGWTVAAQCASVGDSTMLDDYYAGNKPAKIIAAMFMHQQGDLIHDPLTMSCEDLKELCDTIEYPEWLYFASKRVQHGTNYLLGIPTMIQQIVEDSYKISGSPTYVSRKDCQQLQILYITRYPGVRGWQEKVQSEIDIEPTMLDASGHRRTFFGRKRSHALYREATAHEPQSNTTFATSLAALKLWNDPDNRAVEGGEYGVNITPDDLIIQPLHQVHDAMCGQFPIARTEWATDKIRTYFDNTLNIAGIDIKIPFEGEYGPSWGEMNKGLI